MTAAELTAKCIGVTILTYSKICGLYYGLLNQHTLLQCEYVAIVMCCSMKAVVEDWIKCMFATVGAGNTVRPGKLLKSLVAHLVMLT